MVDVFQIYKWFFDKIFSFLALLFFSPFFILIILLLMFFADKEIFFLQWRVGYKNHVFKIIKFSTMFRNSESSPDGSVMLRNDPRVTMIGKFLRFSKLNELPQLINILKGDMSFIGPRPLTRSGFELFDADVKAKIYNSKPGITGISSIIFRDEERWVSKTDMDPMEFYKCYIFPYKGQLELWYLNNKSFLTDMLILFLTVHKVFYPNSLLIYKFFPTLPRSSFFEQNSF